MHGLPADLDLTFLQGIVLLQVCTGANEVILNFDGDVSIAVESKCRVRDASGRETAFNHPRSSSAALTELLSDVVTEALGSTDGTLRLAFSRGAIVEIYDSNEHYESYQIRHGSRTYAV